MITMTLGLHRLRFAVGIDTQSSGGNSMSDKPEGPGWWVASDGKWYPPELHPSVRDATTRAKETSPVTEGSQPNRWQGQSDRSTQVGPQFPDLFKKALEGSHLVDNVTVKYDGDDERNVTGPTTAR